MPRAVSLLALLLVLSAVPASAARIQRLLADLQLGDTRDMVEKVYPPKKTWKVVKDKAGFERITLVPGDAKGFPETLAELRLTLRRGRLVLIQLVYDEDASRKTPLNELVGELSLAYGEARRAGQAYWWSGSGAVVRARQAELKAPGKEERVELRTSLELMDRDLFGR
ncbi:MAG TPA: hypothetical protein DCM05_16330 [Elusimicrobia bacterium]|nr:hypothetical protein [Elusimicrobiota bacterium]